MKRTIILLTMLLATIGGSLLAQDTIEGLKNNYFIGHELDPKVGLTSGMAPLKGSGSCGGINSKYFFVDGKDSLKVIGVAAAMTTLVDVWGGWPSPYDTIGDSVYYNPWFTVYDSSFANTMEYLGVYKHEGDTLRLLDQKSVHYLTDTPAFYHVAMGVCLLGDEDGYPVFGVYEKYFDTPLMLTDSFYVGVTTYSGWRDYIDSTGHYWLFKDVPFILLSYYFPDTIYNPDTVDLVRLINEKHVSKAEYPSGEVYWGFDSLSNFYYYIFPILAVDTTVTPIDTVTPGGDTTGVQRADLVSRYVSVLPNPAHERAEVLSSFGLTLIELYDEQGRRLRSLPASGLKATLDLHTLPPATYLLRIHTPAGTATKKLLVR